MASPSAGHPGYNCSEIEEALVNEKNNPTLTVFLKSRITHLYVEFLQQGGKKPHVVFRLLTEDSITPVDSNGVQNSCRECILTMDPEGSNLNEGVLRVKLTPYGAASDPTGVRFRFPVQASLWVWMLIRILKGNYEPFECGFVPFAPQKDQFSNLTLFKFVVGNPHTRALDGSRDIVSQWMIRLHRLGFVRWEVVPESVSDFVFDPPVEMEFHHVIGNNYVLTDEMDRTGQFNIVRVIPLLIDRGIFVDKVRRVDRYGDWRLPYSPARGTRDAWKNTETEAKAQMHEAAEATAIPGRIGIAATWYSKVRGSIETTWRSEVRKKKNRQNH